jgi:hypothetical protein
MKRESDRKIRQPHSRAKLLTRILLEYRTATDRRNYILRERSGSVVVHTARSFGGGDKRRRYKDKRETKQMEEREIMKLNKSYTIALAAACCLVLASYVTAGPGGGHGGGHGQSTSQQAVANSSDDNDTTDQNTDTTAKKTRKSKRSANANSNSTTRGNSAFGHQQGDATTRTTGSQNNAYGQGKAADAKAKGTEASPTPTPGG